MVNNIIISNKTKEVKRGRKYIGVVGENGYETLRFVFDEFLDGIGILEVQKSNSEKEYIVLEKQEDCYLLEVKNSLLTLEGEITMQLVVRMPNNKVFKSAEFVMNVLKAIEATTEIPDEYETWDSTISSKIIEIDNKLEDITNLEQDLQDKVESGYFKGEKGDTGESGQDGVNGHDGLDGKSAYQIWLEEGNSGTEQDFLNSLKGADGIDGIDGKNGKDGKDGLNGANGINGQDGYTPVKGIDYWTNEDKAEIISNAINQVELDIQQDINSKENISNKVTSLSANSTNTQYPSAKCVYDLIGNIELILQGV